MQGKLFETVCYAIAIVCIPLGLVLALALVWVNSENEFLGKLAWSVFLLFCASVVALALSKKFRTRDDDHRE